MKQFIVCHKVASIDGRIACDIPCFFVRKDINFIDDSCVWITYTPVK